MESSSYVGDLELASKKISDLTYGSVSRSHNIRPSVRLLQQDLSPMPRDMERCQEAGSPPSPSALDHTLCPTISERDCPSFAHALSMNGHEKNSPKTELCSV